MITINDRMYEKIADLLLRRIEETHFFNGTIEYDTDEFYSSLVCTLIVCRDQENGRSCPYGGISACFRPRGNRRPTSAGTN